MPFNISEFFEFVKYYLPQTYTIAGGVILLAWLLAQIEISEKSKSYVTAILWTIFVAAIISNLSIAAVIFLQKNGLLYLHITSAVLTHKLYVASMAVFYVFGVFSFCFTADFDQIAYPVLVYFLAIPIVFSVHLYQFFQLSQIALGQ